METSPRKARDGSAAPAREPASNVAPGSEGGTPTRRRPVVARAGYIVDARLRAHAGVAAAGVEHLPGEAGCASLKKMPHAETQRRRESPQPLCASASLRDMSHLRGTIRQSSPFSSSVTR